MEHSEKLKMQIKRAVPILRIFDEVLAREFYVDFLEFEVEFEHRFEAGLPLYMGLRKSDCRLHLTGHHGDCCPGARIYLEVEGLAGYQESLLAKSYKHCRPGKPQPTSWNTLELTVGDPFGNRLTFSESLG